MLNIRVAHDSLVQVLFRVWPAPYAAVWQSRHLFRFVRDSKQRFSSIRRPLDGSKSVTDEIFAWNETMKTSSKSRLVRNGRRQTAPDFGLGERHILTIERLVVEPVGMLGRTSIADQFDKAFFNIWMTGRGPIGSTSAQARQARTSASKESSVFTRLGILCDPG